jgi:hypothetical protein
MLLVYRVNNREEYKIIKTGYTERKMNYVNVNKTNWRNIDTSLSMSSGLTNENVDWNLKKKREKWLKCLEIPSSHIHIQLLLAVPTAIYELD